MDKDTVFWQKNTLNLGGKVLDLSAPAVMSILNLTSDSFYSGSRVKDEKTLLERASEMLKEGADILDIGAYSTRPGAAKIPAEEEEKKVKAAVQVLKKAFPEAKISIDTFRSEVARTGIGEGADMINDVSGGGLDKGMFKTVGELKVPYVLMHMRGTPQTMTGLTEYKDLLKEITLYFQKKIELLEKLGVKDIVLDPGIGFAKNIQQNYYILQNLAYFKIFNLPLLVGLSRKSFIYKKLKYSPEESLTGSIAANTIALMNGAGILRVHDVKAAKETIKIYKAAYS